MMPIVRTTFGSRAPVAAVLLSGITLLTLSGCGSIGGVDSGNDTPQESADPGTVNRPPQIAGTPQLVVAPGQQYAFTPNVSDPDGDSLTFYVQNLPAWATLDANTGRIAGTPTAADIGTFYDISIRVSDGRESATLSAYSVTVRAVSLGAATVSWTAPTLRSDGTALTNLAGYRIHYGNSANDLREWLAIDNAGINTYVIGGLPPGTWYFGVVAVDSLGRSSSISTVASKTIS